MCKITNSKKQTPNKHQKTKNEIRNKKILEFKGFENWSLFVICNLHFFGILLSSSQSAQ